MSTFSPERVLTRPASGRPLWKEGWLAAALWLLGGLFTLAWPDAGRRWYRLAKGGRWRSSPLAADCCCWR